MSTKFYWALWTILALATAALFVIGDLTAFSISVVGFVATLLILVGMMCVTPILVGPHADEFRHRDTEPLPEPKRVREPVRAKLATAGVAIQSHHAH